MESQWRAISDLAQARALRIQQPYSGNAKLGLCPTRLERVSRTRSDQELLGKPNMYINYAYGGVEPRTNVPFLSLCVEEIGRAAKLLDQVAATAAGA